MQVIFSAFFLFLSVQVQSMMVYIVAYLHILV